MRTRTPDEPTRADELDEVLESLGQLFADLGLVVRILQERRAAADWGDRSPSNWKRCKP
jgi:hypothetical protein